MRKIILASHGEIAKGLLHSATMIVGGLAEGIETYSLYAGQVATDFVEPLKEEVEKNQETEYVVFVDIYGASVCSAFYALAQYDNVKIFTGMSFHMLLELLTEYPNPLSKEDMERLIENARNSIRFVEMEKQEEEDF